MQPVLNCVSLSKSYPGVVALDRLDFVGEAGTVHAVLGENGAGKSTFMKMLGGTVRPDSGSIELFGERVDLRSVRDARQNGVSVAYQELSLVPDLTVGQNIWLNRSETANPLAMMRESTTTRCTEELCARLDAPVVDPRYKVRDLSIAARHVVEIVASVATNPRVLVLDEATAALPAAESNWALGLAVTLAKQGSLVLFISHRLHECREIAERFTVLRRGRAIRSGVLADASDEDLIEDMLGRKPRVLYPPPKAPPSTDKLLSVRRLSVSHELHDVTFELHEGEILGVGGLEGQGQSALMLSLFGMKPHKGEITVAGKPVHIGSPQEAFRAGVGLVLVPEDRRYQGLHLEKSIRENIALPILPKLAHFGFVIPSRDAQYARHAVQTLDIKVNSIEQPAKTLSGGNQQKVVVAKMLAVGARILLLYDVTRGIDVGTKAEIFHLMRELAASGHAILFYSSESQELANLCDRILVLQAGMIAAVLEDDNRTEERILQAAMGREPGKRDPGLSASLAETAASRPGPFDVPRGLMRRLFSASEDLVVHLLPYALLMVVVVWLGILQPASVTLRYQQNVVNLSLVLILIAFGQAPVTMTGGIDLSVPGVLSVVNSIAATQMDTFGHAVVIAVVLLALGWAPGVINGLLVVRGRMQPFIVTLATWFIWGGIAFYVLPGPGGQVDATLSSLLLGQFLGLSGTTWMLIVLLAFAIWFSRTRLGLSIRAIGSDRVSAGHSGVAIARTQIAAYGLSSWFAVVAGIVLSIQSMSGEPTVGNNYVLPMITAVVVGGVSLLGGKGSLIGPIVGAIVLSYLTGVTFSFRLQPQWNQIFQGFLLVVAISSTHLLQRLVRKYRERRAL